MWNWWETDENIIYLYNYVGSWMITILFFIPTGFLYSYLTHQVSLWAIFYAAVLFWAVVSPFQYRRFKNAGHLKYVCTAMIIAGVLLPCLPGVINVAFGYGLMNLSPMICLVAVQDVGFYTDALSEGFEAVILGTLLVLVFFILVKVSVYWFVLQLLEL